MNLEIIDQVKVMSEAKWLVRLFRKQKKSVFFKEKINIKVNCSN